MAGASIEHILRDVYLGWLLWSAHANGASMFFIAVYLHMFRSIAVCSTSSPREMVWCIGVIIVLLMIATAFPMGWLCTSMRSNEFLGCHGYN